MASNSGNNVPAIGPADSGGNKSPKSEASSVETNSGPRTAASASEAFGGANPFDVSAIPSSLNDPSLKELAEQIPQSRNSDNNVPASEVAQSVSWLDLPRDVTMRILMKLSTVEILKSAQFVCKFWYLLCKDPAMWRIIDVVNIGGRMLDSYEVMIFDAIDRSAGGLQEFNIEYLGCDNVLPYLAERAKVLKCLRLRDCLIEEDNMIEAVKKLPLLEEVERSCCFFSGKAVKAIGCSCPQLKSFKLNGVSFDEESLAIAESIQICATLS